MPGDTNFQGKLESDFELTLDSREEDQSDGQIHELLLLLHDQLLLNENIDPGLKSFAENKLELTIGQEAMIQERVLSETKILRDEKIESEAKFVTLVRYYESKMKNFSGTIKEKEKERRLLQRSEKRLRIQVELQKEIAYAREKEFYSSENEYLDKVQYNKSVIENYQLDLDNQVEWLEELLKRQAERKTNLRDTLHRMLKEQDILQNLEQSDENVFSQTSRLIPLPDEFAPTSNTNLIKVQSIEDASFENQWPRPNFECPILSESTSFPSTSELFEFSGKIIDKNNLTVLGTQQIFGSQPYITPKIVESFFNDDLNDYRVSGIPKKKFRFGDDDSDISTCVNDESDGQDQTGNEMTGSNKLQYGFNW